MKTPSEPSADGNTGNVAPKRPVDASIARLMGLGERSVQKSYYPQLQQKIRELEQSESRYRLLAENISDVIFMLDLELTIDYISPSVRRTSGYTAEELIGRPFTDILEPDQAGSLCDQIREEIADPVCLGNLDPHKVKELEVQQANKDGSRTWIEIRISCVREDKGQGARLLGIARDITERRNAQNEKEEIQRQLMQAQKMESIGTLAGGIAHDFNNLLTVINGYANLILGKLDPGDPMEKKLAAIAHAGKRAEELTRQLLAFSRKQIFSPHALDINDTITAMDQMLRRLIGEDIHVETLLGKEVGPISADQAQIEQIFTNLVVNARDSLNAVPGTGFKKRLTIETGQTRFNPDTAARLEIENPGLYVYFSVSDNGTGMAPETQKRIFEPFFTTKSKYKGTGLGLAMIYGIVKQNKGAIRVYSEPGHGAMFKIYWPVAPDAARPVSQTPVLYQNLSGSETILLVEDDIEVLHFAANALMSLGYDIHKASNGKEALDWVEARVRSGGTLPEVVITDLIMPELSGRAFAEKAGALIPGLKVIYASGHTDNHIVHNGMLADGINFIQKPYSQQRLARTIRKVLA